MFAVIWGIVSGSLFTLRHSPALAYLLFGTDLLEITVKHMFNKSNTKNQQGKQNLSLSGDEMPSIFF
ncbi:hypothetical protein GFJ39_05920 [Gluconobacter sp. AC10]|uniref:Uncharacterized protein n=1 Tax=Gluconobacter aidae TaxID=2662454 RepID=A0A7X1SPF0_9PROT|nr:hypothetical protein [Gluconobacter aidae]